MCGEVEGSRSISDRRHRLGWRPVWLAQNVSPKYVVIGKNAEEIMYMCVFLSGDRSEYYVASKSFL